METSNCENALVFMFDCFFSHKSTTTKIIKATTAAQARKPKKSNLFKHLIGVRSNFYLESSDLHRIETKNSLRRREGHREKETNKLPSLNNKSAPCRNKIELQPLKLDVSTSTS